jgi:Ca2+-binding EF-hand superfamily protein
MTKTRAGKRGFFLARLICRAHVPFAKNAQPGFTAVMRTHSFIALILSCLATSPALAQVEATSDYLARMDSDADGRVSLAEYQDWMGYAFERMDLDADGTLTPDELPGGRGKPVTLSEHRAKLARTFLRQDLNRDGYLDARELSAPPQ